MALQDLSPEQVAWIKARGLNPEDFAVDPSIGQPQQQAAAPESSALGAAGRGALASALPTIAGGLATAAGIGLAPVTGGASALLIPAALGLTAGIGTGMAQSALMPDEWKQKLAQDYQEHPWASTAGSLATLPLGGFNPSGDVLKAGQLGVRQLVGRLGRGADNIAPQAMSAGERQIVSGVLGGAGIGAGTTIAADLATGNEITPGGVLEGAAIGSTFNRVNMFGRGYGFKPHTPQTDLAAEAAAKLGSNEPAAEPTTRTGRKPVTAVDLSQQIEANVGPGMRKGEKYIPANEAAVSGLNMQSMFDANLSPAAKAEADRLLNIIKFTDSTAAERGEARAKLSELYAAEDANAPVTTGDATVAQRRAATEKLQAARAAALANQVNEGGALPGTDVARPEVAQGQFVGNKMTRENNKNVRDTPQQEIYDAIENSLAGKRQTKKSDKNQYQSALSPEEEAAMSGASQKELEAYLREQNKSSNLTQEFLEYFTQKFLTPKGLVVRISKDLPQARGMYADGEIHITDGTTLSEATGKPIVATIDTLPHEGQHWLWSKMPDWMKEAWTNQTASRVAEINALNAKRKGAPLEGRDILTPEEHFATEMGMSTLNRLFKTHPTWSNWFKDIKNVARLNLGREVKAEDIVHWAAEKMLKEGQLKGMAKPSVLGGVAVAAEEAAKPDLGTPEEQAKRKADFALAEQERAANPQFAGEETGLRQTREQKNAYNVQRRANLKAETEALNLGERTGGRPPTTYPEDRARLISPLTGDKTDAAGNVILNTETGKPEFPGERTQVRYVVNKVINRLEAMMYNRQTGKEAPFTPESMRKDIVNDVIMDLEANGIDQDGIYKSAARRAAGIITKNWQEYKKNPKTFSLQAKVGKSGEQTVEEKIPSRTAQEVEEGIVPEVEGVEPQTAGAITQEVSKPLPAAEAKIVKQLEKSGKLAPVIEQTQEIKQSRVKAGVGAKLADAWINLYEGKIEDLAEKRDFNLEDAENSVEAAKIRAKYDGEIAKVQKVISTLESRRGQMVGLEDITKAMPKFAGEETGLKSEEAKSPLVAERLLSDRAKFANNPNAKFISKQSFVARIRKGISDDEMAALKDAGFDKWLASKHETINLDEAQKWMKENGPKIEVHTYGMEGKVSEAKREYDKMAHEWYDTQDTFGINNFQQFIAKRARKEGVNSAEVSVTSKELQDAGFSKEFSDNAEKFVALKNQLFKERVSDTSPRATDYYQRVSALPPNQPMPAWTSTKSGKNVQRVDVVIPVKQYGKDATALENVPAGTKLAGDSRSGYREHIKWEQDNLHENLPNTLGWAMIQYKTGPKGEKIALITEAQSRWGQSVRYEINKYKKLVKEGVHENSKEAEKDFLATTFKQDHPLLNHYNRLIMKAAIEQARKEGATHIAVPDAETVMMSEGHDLQLRKEFKTAKEAQDYVKENEHNGVRASVQEGNKHYAIISKDFDPAFAAKEGFKISQEDGMKVNYDRILPGIAEHLTGSRGDYMHLGEHKNAYKHAGVGPDEIPEAQRAGYIVDAEGNAIAKRDNLTIRNADGSIKTDITAKVYPLDKISAKLEQEPFTTYGKYASATTGLKPTSHAFLRPLEATFDRVEKYDPELAQAFRNWGARKDEYLGLRNAAINDLSKFNKGDVARVAGQMRNDFRAGKTTLSAYAGKDKQIADALSGYYSRIADIRRNLGMTISGRIAGKNVNYVPDQLSAEAVDLFVNQPLSAKADALKNDWVSHIMTIDPTLRRADVETDINDYVSALGAGQGNYLSVNFGALRKAEGFGLPDSIREKDAMQSIEKYGRRAAGDLALFQELESKPNIRAQLGLRDPATGAFTKVPGVKELSQAKEVKDSMKWVTGDFGNKSLLAPRTASVVRLINNALLGPATGARDIVAIPANALPYITSFSDLASAWKGVMEFRKNSRAALETGARQPSIDKLQFDQIMNAPDRFTELVGKGASLARVAQGREAMENFGRNVTFSMGKELARNWIFGAKAGNVKAQMMLKKFDTNVPTNLLTLAGADLEKAINQIGKNFTDRNQGTYGGAGLPAGIMESQFAPFYALQKWSVEKSNVIYKDVVEPFLTGENRLPMLTYTLGTVLTGAAIQQLNELMSGRKGQDPTIKEVIAQGRPQDYVAQLATLMQLGSFAGVVGDAMKFGSEFGIYGKTPRNLVSFPTASAALNLQEQTTDLIEAIKMGENPSDVLSRYAIDLFTKNVQGARMIANRTINEEKVERSDKFRDYRTFQQLGGAPAKDFPRINPYLGAQARGFKQTADIGKASAEAPKLIARIISESGGDIEKLRDRMASLKQNSYQTMPGLATTPIRFAKYYRYLAATQGEEAAQQALQDYMRQNAVNKVKSAMIPKL